MLAGVKCPQKIILGTWVVEDIVSGQCLTAQCEINFNAFAEQFDVFRIQRGVPLPGSCSQIFSDARLDKAPEKY